MAEMTIRLEIDPVTRRKQITVGYKSDSDALPHEHEEEHSRLVRKLIEKGVLSEDEAGSVEVRREVPAGTAEVSSGPAPAAREARKA